MAKHTWSVACRTSPLDAQDGLSLKSVVEEIQVGGLPGSPTTLVWLPVNFHLVSAWRRDDLSAPEQPSEMRVVFVGPHGEELGETPPHPLNLADTPTTRATGVFESFPFSGFGFYLVRVQLRRDEDSPWMTVTEVPIHLREMPPASGATQVAP
jgi:hypothetical protein